MGTPKPTPKVHSHFYLLIFLSWVPARLPKTKAPSSPGVLTPAPSFLASHSPGPHMREGQAECPSKGQSTQRRGDREEGKRDPFSSEFPSSLLPLPYPPLPSIQSSIHPSLKCLVVLLFTFFFLSRYFLRFFFFSLILYFTDITRIVYCFLLSACRTYRITHTHTPCSWGRGSGWICSSSSPAWGLDGGHGDIWADLSPAFSLPRLTHPAPSSYSDHNLVYYAFISVLQMRLSTIYRK